MFVNASTKVPYGSNPPTYGVTGEYQLCADAAQQDAADSTHKLAVAARLRQAFATHRNTFVTQSDFQLMASVGINAVRIPVGYWLLAQTAVRRFWSACHNQSWRHLPRYRMCRSEQITSCHLLTGCAFASRFCS